MENDSLKNRLDKGKDNTGRCQIRASDTLTLEVVRIVPEADDRFFYIVFISQDAQAGGAEQEALSILWLKPEPTRSQHPKKMSAGEKQDVAAHSSYLLHDLIGTRSHLCWRFSSRTAVPE